MLNANCLLCAVFISDGRPPQTFSSPKIAAMILKPSPESYRRRASSYISPSPTTCHSWAETLTGQKFCDTFRISSFNRTWQGLTIMDLDALAWYQWLKPAYTPHVLLAAGPHFCLRVCLRAKVLVSYWRPYPGGSDPEEGPRSPADKLLGKHSAPDFQLHLVPEESVHGADQLLPGSCKHKATVYYFQLCADTVSQCSVSYLVRACRSSSTPGC